MTRAVAAQTSIGGAILRKPFEARSWVEIWYIVLAIPLACIGFGFVVLLLICVPLSVTFVGVPLMAVALSVATRIGSVHRRLAVRLLGVHIDAPASRARGEGLFGWLQSVLGDSTRWRAFGYLVWKLPYAAVCGYAVVLTWGYASAAFTYPLWQRFAVSRLDGSQVVHHGVSVGNGYYLDSWPWLLGAFFAGVCGLLASPWIIHGFLAVDRWVMRQLLGATVSQRVRELEGARAFAMDDAATTLRRIERDLHDGAQARMVAVALAVGMARDTLGNGDATPDVVKTRELLETANRQALDAISDLRDLARGIHPAVLDAGLETALTTLAAGSPIPVQFSYTLAERASPAIETIAYFCSAELLTNVAKHSAAGQAYLEVTQQADQLRLRVVDDGRGGADAGRGSGLRGLTDRVRAVDGRLALSSPSGGPTVVVIDLPFQS